MLKPSSSMQNKTCVRRTAALYTQIVLSNEEYGQEWVWNRKPFVLPVPIQHSDMKCRGCPRGSPALEHRTSHPPMNEPSLTPGLIDRCVRVGQQLHGRSYTLRAFGSSATGCRAPQQ